MRRALRSAATVLIVAGLLLLTDAALTVAWQEPVSAIYGRLSQRALDAELRRAERLELPAKEQRVLRRLRTPSQRMGFLARRARRSASPGRAIGRIRARAAGIDFAVVHGTDPKSLRRGPGHYPRSSMPGQSGTVAIAGHRTTYQAPFRRLDDFEAGNEIRLDMPYGRFVYRVERTRIVSPDAWWVTRDVGYPRLVLTACHPLYSAAQRIVVFARLVRSTPSRRAGADA